MRSDRVYTSFLSELDVSSPGSSPKLYLNFAATFSSGLASVKVLKEVHASTAEREKQKRKRRHTGRERKKEREMNAPVDGGK